jgi:lysozyme family protein
MFDCGLLNGVGTAARILQARLGVDIDGDIGPETLGACARADWAALINQICNERLRRMQSASAWPVFCVEWTRRVQRVRADALLMAGGGGAPGATPSPRSIPSSLPLPSVEDIAAQMQEPEQNGADNVVCAALMALRSS